MSKNEKNSIRKSQLITTYGVGSLFPLQSGDSAIILGLDSWFDGKSPQYFDHKEIIDHRFSARLGTKMFIEPPIIKEGYNKYSKGNIIIPAKKFPRLYYCNFCGSMKKVDLDVNEEIRCDNEDCRGRYKGIGPKMIQDRFLVFSKDLDYIDDFPIFEWVHNNECCANGGTISDLTRTVSNKTLGFDGIFYHCSKCEKTKTLSNIFSKNIMKKYVDFDKKIWLTNESKAIHEDCDISVGLKGGTNIWRPLIYTSLQIKVENNSQKNIERYVDSIFESFILPTLSTYSSVETIPEFIKNILVLRAKEKNITDIGSFLNYCYKKVFNSLEKDDDENITEELYRFDEYCVINTKDEVGDIDSKLHILPIFLKNFEQKMSNYFDVINIIPQLTVIQAMAGFTRDSDNNDLNRAKANMTAKSSLKIDWLPAIENHGEGIFINFNTSILNEWSVNPKVINRVNILSKNRKLAAKSFGKEESFNINPKFVLLHTFSHILINELSFQCGYSSSSLKERIYCKINIDNESKDEMNGLLIYVASGDIDGSLGGLVRMGKPGHFEDVVFAAIDKAKWCSSDPLCIESKGQGPNSCNLAACCNCALLPETCCDGYWNMYLDRGLLIGTIEDSDIGFFS